MKKLLASVFLLFSLSAIAEEPFVHREMYAVNGDGGILTITNEPCELPGNPLVGHGWFATTELVEGTLEGCWIFGKDAPVLFIFWADFHKMMIKDPDSVFSLEKPVPPPKKTEPI
jgi:hypothetical protein